MTESAEGSRIIQAWSVPLDAGGGAGHPDRVSSTEIPARAGDAGAALTPRDMGVSSDAASAANSPAGSLCQPAVSFPRGAIVAFIRSKYDDIALMRRQRKSWDAIAAELGVNLNTLSGTYYRDKRKREPCARLADFRVSVIAMRSKGMRWKQIARTLGVDYRSISQRAYLDGWLR